MNFQERNHAGAKDPWQAKTWTGTTPIGTARFPKMLEPDSYDPSKPKFNCGIAWDSESKEVQELEARFNEMLDWAETQMSPAVKKKTNERVLPIKTETKKFQNAQGEEDFEETGRVFISPGTYARDRSGKIRYVPMVDSLNQRLAPMEVTGGSQVRANITVKAYWMNGKLGLTLYLNALQVVEMAAGFGAETDFGVIEGGFTASEQTPQHATSEGPSDSPF